MTGFPNRYHPAWLLLAALLSAVGMKLYTERVLIPRQISDAARYQRPRGNMSDFYPPWLAAREFLLHGRDPYSDAVTRDIQTGFYGRPLDPTRPDDPTNEERFAYPVYVSFLLAPLLHLRFETAEVIFVRLMLLALIGSVPLWLRILRWRVSLWMLATLVLFTISSPGARQALGLRQLSLVVMGLVFAGAMLLVSGRQISAGFLFALATIKPQLLWIPVLWLGVWTAADWRHRYRLAVSFVLTLCALLAASEALLPGWIFRFWNAVQEYPRYTGTASLVTTMVSPAAGVVAGTVTLATTGWICWRERKENADTEAFARTFCLVLAVSVFVAPTFVHYNHILLLPAVLLLARDMRSIAARGRLHTALLGLATITIAWPWIGAIALTMLSFVLPSEQVQRLWAAPVCAVWTIPITVTAPLLLFALRKRSEPGSAQAGTA